MALLETADIQVLNGDLQISAYLAQPANPGIYPAVIVIQEVFGVNSHIRNVTERIAQAGYVAIAPAIYQRQAPGFQVGYTEAELALGRQYKEMTKASELLSDIQATINYLKTLPTLKPNSFGTIGFCFGGHVVYLAATLPDIKATASFYGAGITTYRPGGGPPTVNITPQIHGIIHCFFGTQDPLIPVVQIDEIEQALEKHQIKHKIWRYPADHGFFCDQRNSYDPIAAQDAWTKVQQLFQTTLNN